MEEASARLCVTGGGDDGAVVGFLVQKVTSTKPSVPVEKMTSSISCACAAIVSAKAIIVIRIFFIVLDVLHKLSLIDHKSFINYSVLS